MLRNLGRYSHEGQAEKTKEPHANARHNTASPIADIGKKRDLYYNYLIGANDPDDCQSLFLLLLHLLL